MGWYCNVIAVDPVDPDVVWAAGVDLFRSDDGGRSWGLASYWWARDLGPSFVHADQHAIVFHPDYDGVGNTSMFSATDGGVFRTDNPSASLGRDATAVCDFARSSVDFTPLNHNFGITQFYHGAPYPGAESYIGGTQDNGTLLGQDEEGSDGWLHVSGGDGGYVAVDPSNPDFVYAESQRFYFKRSTDGGRTFRSTRSSSNRVTPSGSTSVPTSAFSPPSMGAAPGRSRTPASPTPSPSGWPSAPTTMVNRGSSPSPTAAARSRCDSNRSQRRRANPRDAGDSEGANSQFSILNFELRIPANSFLVSGRLGGN
jgi:hypothetical protein